MKERLNRERKTINAMIGLYCRRHHGNRPDLCGPCAFLLAYAKARLDKCPYGQQKPTCGQCPVHCYKPAMRENVRDVMRYAGPRMIWHHPLLAIQHMLDGFKIKKKVKAG